MKSKKIIALAATLAVAFQIYASKPIYERSAPEPASGLRSVMSGCSSATAQTDLDINNVRATILNGGDMWWDLLRGQYEVPKGGHVTSLYAGSLWIGGVDNGGNLKVAAMTYRQHGNDFWPGPLDASGATDESTCLQWDRHFTVTREEVETFLSTGVATQGILDWPAYSADGHALAPYFDADGSGTYNPLDGGDYPDYDMTGTRACSAQLKGDKTLWWVFNDKGNSHTETGGNAIGLEIQAQAFAFSTNDEINNMTFYKYKIVNKSSYDINNTYFGVWADPDLGGSGDDYVGCDVARGLGYCYNGDLVDDESAGGELTYGANPPAIGIDFFEGPFANPNGMADPVDSSANGLGYNDNIVDNERLGMSKFVYYTNGAASGQGDPNTAVEFYGYLSGKWKDNTPFTYGGTGHLSGGVVCDYMFPGSSDPTGYGTNRIPQSAWDEFTVGNPPGDRRFLQSAGPFKLLVGSVNYVTTGVVWARATQGGNLASLALLKTADTKAQALFKNCFKLLDGPTAPDMAIQELNNQLIFSLSQSPISNNINEGYQEKDPYGTGADTLYKFEGYQVFQLKDPTVSINDIHNVDKARLVMQCDVKNDASQIINYVNDPGISAWVPVEEVNGANNGVIHTFPVTVDKFATGVNTLVNHKQYYYMVIAYAYNPGELSANPYISLTANMPYLSGRKNVKVYTGIPHIPSPEENGTIQNSAYGSGPKITRIEGQGNGGNVLDLTPETENSIVTSLTGRAIELEYQNNKGPVNVKVIDPLNVPLSSFTIKFNGVTTAATWSIVNNNTGESIPSQRSIAIANEQVFPQWGLSISINQVPQVGTFEVATGGFMEANMVFSDPTRAWLSGVPDEEGATPANWIRAGNVITTGGASTAFDDRYKLVAGVPEYVDPQAKFEKILGGTWAPYALCAYSDFALTSIAGPAVTNGSAVNILQDSLAFLSSIDVVITKDQTKWTRCPVLEMQEEATLSEGGALKLNLRKHASVNKAGNTSTGDDNNDFPTGMGWFPGYAINIETGERLNIAFGEDSWLTSDNGANMKWDPTSTMYSAAGAPAFGGKHYIYVFGHNGDAHWPATDILLPNELRDVPRYDKGVAVYKMLKAAELGTTATYRVKKNAVFIHAMWVNIPLLAEGHQLQETDVKVRIRVAKPYASNYTSRWGSSAAVPSTDTAAVQQNHNFPLYTFKTDEIQTVLNDGITAKEAMNLINIVPNPYYAYSAYEKTALENTVKITNLPVKCTITIYTLNGTVVKTINKDNDVTSVDWDLKNFARVPIASGMYIIHVDADGIGERTMKWFGVLRPQDLDSY